MHSSRYTNYIMHTCCKSIIDVTYNIFSQTQVIHNTHTHTQNIHAQVGLVYMRIQVQTTVNLLHESSCAQDRQRQERLSVTTIITERML